jgi:hypothetical protein
LDKWTIKIPSTLNRFATIGKEAHWSCGSKVTGLRSPFSRPCLHINDMGTKRKGSSIATSSTDLTNSGHPVLLPATILLPQKQATSKPIRRTTAVKPTRQPGRRGKVDTNPEHNVDIVDSQEVLRASPDADEDAEGFDIKPANKRPTGPKELMAAKVTIIKKRLLIIRA